MVIRSPPFYNTIQCIALKVLLKEVKIMANVRSEADRKVLRVTQELSELLTSYKYDEAWEKAGELNSLLKKRDELTLPAYMLDMLQQHLKSYYYQNNVVSKARKSMAAIGHKLEEFK